MSSDEERGRGALIEIEDEQSQAGDGGGSKSGRGRGGGEGVGGLHSVGHAIFVRLAGVDRDGPRARLPDGTAHGSHGRHARHASQSSVARTSRRPGPRNRPLSIRIDARRREAEGHALPHKRDGSIEFQPQVRLLLVSRRSTLLRPKYNPSSACSTRHYTACNIEHHTSAHPVPEFLKRPSPSVEIGQSAAHTQMKIEMPQIPTPSCYCKKQTRRRTYWQLAVGSTTYTFWTMIGTSDRSTPYRIISSK